MTSDEVFDDPQDQDDNAAKTGDRLFGKEKIFSGDQRTGSDGSAPRDIPSLHLGTGTKGTVAGDTNVEGDGAPNPDSSPGLMASGDHMWNKCFAPNA